MTMPGVDLRLLSPRLDAAAHSCRAIIETPRGSRGKYSYDAQSGLFELSAWLPEGIAFPLDFGFIPGAFGGDGDPLDIMVIADEPLPVGTLLTTRLIGALEAEDRKPEGAHRNDRLVGVAALSRLHSHVTQLEQLGSGYVDALVQFWIDKDRLQGKAFHVLRIDGAARAVRLVAEAPAGP